MGGSIVLIAKRRKMNIQHNTSGFQLTNVEARFFTRECLVNS